MEDVFYWSDKFLDEVEGKEVDEGILLWALGGASFACRTPQTMVYLDPFFGPSPPDGAYRTLAIPINPDKIRLADVILSSHGHYDHCHKETLLGLMKHTQAICVGPSSSTGLMQEFGIPSTRIREVKEGDTLQFNDVEIKVLPAYDRGEPHAVSFLLISGDTRIFFAGDSEEGPGFEEIGKRYDLDIAMLAFGRTWFMNEAQLVAAAEKLRPKVLIPHHWELWRNHTGDILELGKIIHKQRPNFEVKLLLLGDWFAYKKERKT